MAMLACAYSHARHAGRKKTRRRRRTCPRTEPAWRQVVHERRSCFRPLPQTRPDRALRRRNDGARETAAEWGSAAVVVPEGAAEALAEGAVWAQMGTIGRKTWAAAPSTLHAYGNDPG